MLTGDMPCASESKGGHQQSIPGILWHPSDAPPAHNTMAERRQSGCQPCNNLPYAVDLEAQRHTGSQFGPYGQRQGGSGRADALGSSASVRFFFPCHGRRAPALSSESGGRGRPRAPPNPPAARPQGRTAPPQPSSPRPERAPRSSAGAALLTSLRARHGRLSRPDRRGNGRACRIISYRRMLICHSYDWWTKAYVLSSCPRVPWVSCPVRKLVSRLQNLAFWYLRRQEGVLSDTHGRFYLAR